VVARFRSWTRLRTWSVVGLLVTTKLIEVKPRERSGGLGLDLAASPHNFCVCNVCTNVCTRTYCHRCKRGCDRHGSQGLELASWWQGTAEEEDELIPAAREDAVLFRLLECVERVVHGFAYLAQDKLMSVDAIADAVEQKLDLREMESNISKILVSVAV